MRIDYTISPQSKYFLFTDVPFRQGIQHLGLSFSKDRYGLSRAERVTHFVIGILKLIPILGHLIALLDTVCQRRTITHLKLAAVTPYERGFEHGTCLQERIREVYEPLLHSIGNDSILRRNAARFERQIPESVRQEMQGLATGSGYSYDDVFFLHSFLDANPSPYSTSMCTSMVVKETPGRGFERIAAANHSISNPVPPGDSGTRRDAFLRAMIRPGSEEEVLKTAAHHGTIQAMIFDPVKGVIKLGSRGSYAAHGNFQTFEPDTLFNTHDFDDTNSNSTVKVFRNLDWPWHFLGQNTLVLTRLDHRGNSTVSITWPGYIGTLSGMNSRGLSLAQNSRGTSSNFNGISNPLLNTYMLDTCNNVTEANTFLMNNMHGSAVNLIVADKNTAKSYEFADHWDGGEQNHNWNARELVECVGEIL